LLEKGGEEKIGGYGTTDLCTTDQSATAKAIGSRAEGARSLYNEAVSDYTSQCERRARLGDRLEGGLLGRHRAQYDQWVQSARAGLFKEKSLPAKEVAHDLR
jgi:hypothetical protein